MRLKALTLFCDMHLHATGPPEDQILLHILTSTIDDRYLFHIRKRCSWPRITRLQHICLLNALSYFPSSSNSNPLSSPYTLPLRSKSRPQSTISDILSEHAAVVLFFCWSWADNVLRLALTELDPEWVTECHDRDFNAALDVFQSTLVEDQKALRECVERMIEETLDENTDSEGEGDDEVPVDAEAKKAKEEQDKEQTKDLAKITTTKIIEAKEF
ncbi:uncharacterized protein BDR25DRAFT_358513 [Lindgomyces ingoldianus]|uniref:Uncharacterized protein n=1 Tax=Lindgomyces ingoldianus TaxID=673940 RepID=A0ACB6QM61_9PLEO|nr:uncharacterized protein BDR25DRAFT_358513 [Lindgomyces ingoldianus]KAF2467397.1 hypothetical protein BDR25DRAFT_358513 [Lindgomyces ingoldianus]